MSSNFTALLWKLEKRTIVEEGIQREVLNGVFTEHRDRLIAAYGAYMRLYYEFQRRNALFPKALPLVIPEPSREFCNAAIHILTIADESVQRYFLSADEATKTKLSQAVIDDDGIENLAGVWIELPS